MRDLSTTSSEDLVYMLGDFLRVYGTGVDDPTMIDWYRSLKRELVDRIPVEAFESIVSLKVYRRLLVETHRHE